MTILSTINYPDDLRKLSIDELYQLADEIRETIINTVSSNGGHLAPNLGVVELTIAIHYALNTPEDKLIFDVGHQCYAHKIITGRRDVFSTLRQKNGISGFCNKNESIYDINITGHASNSISLALGIASARDIQHEKYHVAVVIGDGALTGGMALEALNQAGDSETPLIVILNDNQHSINGNVGALSQHLSHIRATKSYNTLKLRTRRFIKRIPCLGNILTRLLSSLKNGIKSLFVSGGMFFENLGFIYLGPINGHDIGMTIEMIQKAKRLNKPVLLHIRTRKGYGYLPAEIYPDKWHGTEPFSVLTGEITTPKRPGFTNIFSDEICLIAEKDKNVVAITAAMTQGVGLSDFAARWPKRIFDAGIAEQHAAGLAAGLSLAGMKPVLAIYSTFLQRAYDQLLEDICLQNIPVVIAIDRSGFVGSDGCSHHGLFTISYLRTMPNMIIMAPSDSTELRMMLRFAMHQTQPVALCWPRSEAYELTEHKHETIVIGQAVLLSEGYDGAIWAIGSMVKTALEAASILLTKGIRLRVVDARFVYPLDTCLLLDSVNKCNGKIITLEENISAGGFGEACHSALSDLPHVQILNLSIPEGFPSHASRNEQLLEASLNAESVSEHIYKHWFLSTENLE